MSPMSPISVSTPSERPALRHCQTFVPALLSSENDLWHLVIGCLRSWNKRRHDSKPSSCRLLPSYSAGALERCFIAKLHGVSSQGSRHRRFEFYDDEGNLVASTVMSYRWMPSTSISARMTSAIQRELKLQGQSRIFDDLVRCPLTREAWLRA